jgi:hypothetical protein
MPNIHPKSQCPHCNATSDIEPAPNVRFRCAVCGGPRVPVDVPGFVASEALTAPLTRARRARFRRHAWGIAAVLVATFAVITIIPSMVILALLKPGIFSVAALALFALAPLVIAGFAWLRSRAARRSMAADLDEAWRRAGAEALGALTQHRGEVDGAAVARALRLDEGEADRLLAELQAFDLAHARVTDEGKLLYSAAALSPSAPRLRVADDGDLLDPSNTSAALDAEASSAALEEAAQLTRQREQKSS